MYILEHTTLHIMLIYEANHLQSRACIHFSISLESRPLEKRGLDSRPFSHALIIKNEHKHTIIMFEQPHHLWSRRQRRLYLCEPLGYPPSYHPLCCTPACTVCLYHRNIRTYIVRGHAITFWLQQKL